MNCENNQHSFPQAPFILSPSYSLPWEAELHGYMREGGERRWGTYILPSFLSGCCRLAAILNRPSQPYRHLDRCLCFLDLETAPHIQERCLNSDFYQSRISPHSSVFSYALVTLWCTVLLSNYLQLSNLRVPSVSCQDSEDTSTALYCPPPAHLVLSAAL